MLTKRIIPCLDVKGGKVVKGVNFAVLSELGDPVEMAARYYVAGADELCFLDISASEENRKTRIDTVRRIAEKIFIPFTVGGGIKSVDDIRLLLQAGADKIALCTQAILDPGIIKEASQRFGSQAIVISLDAKKNGDSWELYIYGGKTRAKTDAVRFAKKCELLGAGELLVNSIDRDGTKKGYDIGLIKKISLSVNIPVIASSGAESPEDMLLAFQEGKADAVLAASMFHYNQYAIADVKKYLKSKGVDVR